MYDLTYMTLFITFERIKLKLNEVLRLMRSHTRTRTNILNFIFFQRAR